MKWFRLYTEIIDDPKLNDFSDTSKWILIGFLSIATELEQNGYIPFSPKKIAWRLRQRVDHVKRALKLCEEAGIIGENGSGYQFINWSKRQYKSDCSTERVKRFRNVSLPFHETPPEQSRADTDQKPPIVPQKGDSDLFEIFWKNYPRKVGKGAAQKAWRKIKEPSSVIEKIKRVLPLQKESHSWTKENGQFIPMPATYLNQRRWEDETIE